MTYKERQELNGLSKKAFGASSRWQKLVNDGYNEPFERDREVMVPKANGQLVKKVFTDKMFKVKRYSVEEVRKLMNEIIETRAALEKNLAEAEAKSQAAKAAQAQTNTETAAGE